MSSESGWRVSYYCSACNSPRGSVIGCHDNEMQIGQCAISPDNYSKHRKVTINGSTYTVEDKTD